MQSIGQWVAELASNTLKEFNAIYYSVAIVFQKLNQIISSSIAAAINLVPDWAKTDTLQGWQDYNEQMAGAYGDSVSQLKKDWDAADISAGKYLDTTRKISTATTQKDREGIASLVKRPKPESRAHYRLAIAARMLPRPSCWRFRHNYARCSSIKG